MSFKRALVDCAVLSLQDTCLFYPCCKCCFSRVDWQRSTERWRCSKCGFNCLKEKVDFRYRLSLRVTRNADIFGVTVFGGCLNPFFGIPAIGLQRLLESSGQNKADFQERLLIQAVEDCFVGKHFIFGIKVPDRVVSSPLFTQAGSSKEPVNLIASQIALSNTAAPGCSVVKYYTALLQKAATSCDAGTGPVPSTSPLRLHQPGATPFDSTLPASPLSPSLRHDDTLSPTPPWQRSLGVVTSSAEPEESCGVRSSGEDPTSGRGPSQSQWRSLCDVPDWLSICQDGSSNVTEGSLTLPRHPPKDASQNGDHIRNVPVSLPGSPGSPGHLSEYCNPVLREWPAPSEPDNKRTIPSDTNVGGSERESDGEESMKPLSNSVIWEDLPFSESLGEFVCDNSLESHEETLKNVLRKNISENYLNASYGRPKVRDLSVKTAPQSSSTPSQPKGAHLHRTSLDATHAGSTNSDGGLTLLTGEKSNGDFSSNNETGLRDRSGVCISVGRSTKKTERTGFGDSGDEYNCSADLFSNSQDSVVAPTQTADTDTVTNTDTRLRTNAEGRHPNVRLSPDSERSVCPHGLDFVPFSQSTPVATRRQVVRLTHRGGLHGDVTPQRHRVTPRASKRTHRRLGCGERVLAQQGLRLQRRTPSKPLERNQIPLSSRETTVCDNEDTMVPPAVKIQPVVKPRVKGVTDTNISKRTLRMARKQPIQQEGPLDRPGAGLVGIVNSEHTGECKDSSAGNVGLGTVFGHFLGDENDACDWSRDLFSDSLDKD